MRSYTARASYQVRTNEDKDAQRIRAISFAQIACRVSEMVTRWHSLMMQPEQKGFVWCDRSRCRPAHRPGPALIGGLLERGLALVWALLAGFSGLSAGSVEGDTEWRLRQCKQGWGWAGMPCIFRTAPCIFKHDPLCSPSLPLYLNSLPLKLLQAPKPLLTTQLFSDRLSTRSKPSSKPPACRHAADQKIHHRFVQPTRAFFCLPHPWCCFHQQPFSFHLPFSSVISQRLHLLQ